jgi:pentatricopeptide repeat protein
MGFQPSLFLANNLVTMYVKCGKLIDARLVFDKMPKRDEVSWSAMISGYAENGFAEEALAFFFRMRAVGMKPNHFIFVGVLQACTCLGDLKLGRQVHAWIVKKGFGENVYLRSALVHHYANCASINDARKVFDEMPDRDVVLWTAMIAGYAGQGHARESLDLFNQMRLVGVEPSDFTFPRVLRACTCMGGIKHGEGVHAYASKIGVKSDAFVGSALVDMYGKCGSLVDARRVFNEIPERDAVMWNGMISGCLQWGCDKQALMLLNQMKSAGLKPDEFLIISVWNSCGIKAV